MDQDLDNDRIRKYRKVNVELVNELYKKQRESEMEQRLEDLSKQNVHEILDENMQLKAKLLKMEAKCSELRAFAMRTLKGNLARYKSLYEEFERDCEEVQSKAKKSEPHQQKKADDKPNDIGDADPIAKFDFDTEVCAGPSRSINVVPPVMSESINDSVDQNDSDSLHMSENMNLTIRPEHNGSISAFKLFLQIKACLTPFIF